MPQTLTVQLDKSIMSAKILANHSSGIGTGVLDRSAVSSKADTEQIRTQDLGAQGAGFSQVCQTLNSVVAKLNQFYDKVFVEHKDEIAKLSVEIARKVLMQKVENGDYEIESIVKEALNNAPTRQDLVVRLNPQDLEQLQKAQQEQPGGDLAGIKFVPDPDIGRAECLLESPKGIIESLIDKHLERVSEALKK